MTTDKWPTIRSQLERNKRFKAGLRPKFSSAGVDAEIAELTEALTILDAAEEAHPA
jgi:hypothetical protein